MPQKNMQGKKTMRIGRTFRHQRWGAGLAFALAMVVGFGVPFSDASSSQAAFALQDESTPSTNTEDQLATEVQLSGDATEPDTEASDVEDAHEPEKDIEAESLKLEAEILDGASEPLNESLDPGFSIMSVPNFNANTNVFYTLDRAEVTAGGTFSRTRTPQISIRQLSFDMSNATPVAEANVVMGGARELVSLQTGPGFLPAEPRTANSLGVTSDGVFYFTTQGSTDSRASNIDIWKYEMMSMPGQSYNPAGVACAAGGSPTGSQTTGYACAPQRMVTNMSLNSPTGGTVVGGAVNPRDGSFYFMYFSATPTGVATPPNNPYGGGNVRAHLYRYDVANNVAGEVAHFDIRQHQAFTSSYNGDIAFDAVGNLLLTVSNTGTGSGVNNPGRAMLATLEFNQFANLPTISWPATDAVPTLIPSSTAGAFGQTELRNAQNGNGMNGLAYTASGQLVMQQGVGTGTGGRISLADPASYAVIGNYRDNSPATGNFVDLASSTSPPVLTVQKNVEGSRYAVGDQFTLSGNQQLATTNVVFDPITTTGDTPGIQSAQIGPLPLQAGGTITVGETITPVANDTNYSSSYECFIENPDGSKGTVFKRGDGRTVTFNYLTEVPGAASGPQQMKCIFTNGPLRPNLETSKSATPASTTSLLPEQIVQYKLEFDNSTGLAAADVDHIDYLADVFDDAEFVANSIRYGDETESDYSSAASEPIVPGVTASDPSAADQMSIAGSVPAGAIRTVWFEVKVKANDTERPAPNAGTDFVLNNFLRPVGENPPDECEPEDENCTTHPIRAWTVSKQSQPPNGAWLHSGGNVYYMIDVTKVGAQDSVIEGIKVVDDMSQVMAVSRMDPTAPDYGPQYRFDVKTYAADGSLQRSFATTPNDAWDGGIAYEQSQLYPVHDGSSNPADPSWEWMTELPTFTLNANEVRAQIVYIVKVGGAADPDDPAAFQEDGAGNPLYPPPMQQPFINSVGATSTTMPPNECVLGDTPVGEMCQVTHQVSDNYFHIQKNSTERDANGNTVWNLVGVEFEIYDATLAAGWPAGSPSANLCWTNYAAHYDADTDTWTAPLDTVGTYSAGAQPDWQTAESRTYQSLIAYNNYLSANGLPTVPQCALSYPLKDASYGQAADTWHVRDLAAGAYELVETKAPDGHQLFAEPIAFDVFGADYQLRLPDPTSPGLYLDRCVDPNQLPSNGTSACVMQTGWLMQVYDSKLQPLPLAGGLHVSQYLTYGAFIILAGALFGVWQLRRRNQATYTDQ